MCGKILKQAIIAICLSLGLSSCCVQVSADGGSMNQAEPKQTITMSISQWNSLKTEFRGLKIDLALERQKLTMLKLDSSEQMQRLEMLQIQLDETQQSLMNAKISMIEAQHELNGLKILLDGLKNKIKKLEHKQAVIRRQRDIYAGLLVITVGAAVARR
jgi:septal ring factor EnvC (AmiA/AmiB activator)